ncbi:tRNA (uracil-5-)-methyltransferase Gid [Bartonella quintana]|nr:methylenetetrahydrofolate-tRNA-(uracil-5-)-methyltransferase TrmFO [Bartonella quintana JK 19]KEC68072.1 methylenetetrahydrofolate-tRNA-(uracil-5-)-methyltransferase TrmFO [Bartonella quintana JK 39]SQF95991.1 tRNA (uracil-5-)-methyltransferase Gid [Bartonella quintana]
MDICWYQPRYDKIGSKPTGKDYLNCPLNKEQYEGICSSVEKCEKNRIL